MAGASPPARGAVAPPRQELVLPWPSAPSPPRSLLPRFLRGEVM